MPGGRKKAGVKKRRLRAQESKLCEGTNGVGAKLQKCRKRRHWINEQQETSRVSQTENSIRGERKYVSWLRKKNQ